MDIFFPAVPARPKERVYCEYSSRAREPAAEPPTGKIRPLPRAAIWSIHHSGFSIES